MKSPPREPQKHRYMRRWSSYGAQCSRSQGKRRILKSFSRWFFLSYEFRVWFFAIVVDEQWCNLQRSFGGSHRHSMTRHWRRKGDKTSSVMAEKKPGEDDGWRVFKRHKRGDHASMAGYAYTKSPKDRRNWGTYFFYLICAREISPTSGQIEDPPWPGCCTSDIRIDLSKEILLLYFRYTNVWA